MATKRAPAKLGAAIREPAPEPEPERLPTTEELTAAIAHWQWCVSEYQRVTIEGNVARRKVEDMLKALGVRQDMIPR